MVSVKCLIFKTPSTHIKITCFVTIILRVSRIILNGNCALLIPIFTHNRSRYISNMVNYRIVSNGSYNKISVFVKSFNQFECFHSILTITNFFNTCLECSIILCIIRNFDSKLIHIIWVISTSIVCLFTITNIAKCIEMPVCI